MTDSQAREQRIRTCTPVGLQQKGVYRPTALQRWARLCRACPGCVRFTYSVIASSAALFAYSLLVRVPAFRRTRDSCRHPRRFGPYLCSHPHEEGIHAHTTARGISASGTPPPPHHHHHPLYHRGRRCLVDVPCCSCALPRSVCIFCCCCCCSLAFWEFPQARLPGGSCRGTSGCVLYFLVSPSLFISAVFFFFSVAALSHHPPHRLVSRLLNRLHPLVPSSPTRPPTCLFLCRLSSFAAGVVPLSHLVPLACHVLLSSQGLCLGSLARLAVSKEATPTAVDYALGSQSPTSRPTSLEVVSHGVTHLAKGSLMASVPHQKDKGSEAHETAGDP